MTERRVTIEDYTKEELLLLIIERTIKGDSSYSTKEDCVNGIKRDGLEVLLSKGFHWTKSAEGHDFWKKVHSQIRKERR